MDFVALILFLALYYLRPQDWSPDFNRLHPIQLLSIVALWGLYRNGKLTFRRLLRTPLDWLVLFYFLWTLIAGNQFLKALADIQSVVLFYFVALRSLETVARQKTFLGWWCFFMVVIAALAIASLYGFDPLGSNPITQGEQKGRLILNLSIFNNPNALAHSVIPSIPLIYFLWVWRRIATKWALAVIAIPAYCILLTQSKGAFLSGFATLIATLIFGRSKIWQVFILVMAIGFGYGALYSLPRMNQLQESKTDPAIQGRVAAFTYGLHLMRSSWYGIGLGNFEDSFFTKGPLEKQEVFRMAPAADGKTQRRRTSRMVHFEKSTHSAYNQNGAELGYVGLFLFVGIIYCCARTLLLMKCESNDEERIRRALFTLVVAYAVSSWMVDFCYRPTFFLFIAAISAFQYHFQQKEMAQRTLSIEPIVTPAPWLRRPPLAGIPGISIPGLSLPGVLGPGLGAPALAASSLAQPVSSGRPVSFARGGRILPWQTPALAAAPAAAAPIIRKPLRDRLGLLDCAIMLALTYGAIQYWQYLIATM